jgi:GLPGLI family protein
MLKAQSYKVEYNTVYEGNVYRNILYADDSISYWEGLADPNTADQAAEWMIKYKHLKQMIYTDYVFQKMFYVSDSLDAMQWTPDTATKIILNYPCVSAITFFRGRKYIAYYTSSLPSGIAPWKFGGLQGAILEVESEDHRYHFEAISIDQEAKEDIDISIDKEDVISWEEYCHQFIKTTNNYVRYMQTISMAQGGTGNLKIDRPEMIYPKAQSGVGLGAE